MYIYTYIQVCVCVCVCVLYYLGIWVYMGIYERESVLSIGTQFSGYPEREWVYLLLQWNNIHPESYKKCLLNATDNVNFCSDN